MLGFSYAPDYTLIPFVRRCETLGLKVSLVPRLFDSVNVRVALDHLGGLPLYGLHSIDPQGLAVHGQARARPGRRPRCC